MKNKNLIKKTTLTSVIVIVLSVSMIYFGFLSRDNDAEADWTYPHCPSDTQCVGADKNGNFVQSYSQSIQVKKPATDEDWTNNGKTKSYYFFTNKKIGIVRATVQNTGKDEITFTFQEDVIGSSDKVLKNFENEGAWNEWYHNNGLVKYHLTVKPGETKQFDLQPEGHVLAYPIEYISMYFYQNAAGLDGLTTADEVKANLTWERL